MALAAVGTGTLLTALGIGGTLLTAAAQFSASRSEAAFSEFNAGVQRQKADNIRKKAELDVSRHRKQARAFTSSQIAAYAAAGIVPDVGSALAVQTSDAADLELDARIIQYNADLEVLNALSGADLSLLRAQEARSSGFIQAGATLLTGIPRILKEA